MDILRACFVQIVDILGSCFLFLNHFPRKGAKEKVPGKEKLIFGL